jgi:hypothetical protein
MQQVARAIGMTLSVYHRVEMASRIIHTDEIDAVAKFYGLSAAKMISLFERRTRDNLQQLEKGVAPEQLLPRTPRALLKEDSKWRRLGALERYAIRRSIRYVGSPDKPLGRLPVYGQMIAEESGACHFVIDRNVTLDQVPVAELLAADDEAFLVRNFSQRLGFLIKPGSLACVEPRAPVAMGDIAFLVRHDRTADAAVVIGAGLGPLVLKMYNPEEEIPIGDPSIAAILRIRMLILP